MELLSKLTPFFHKFDPFMNYIYQLDAFFGFIILLTAALIGLYSYRIYRFTNRRSYLLFSLSFLFIALGYAVKTGIDLLIQVEGLGRELFFGIIGFPMFQRFSLLIFMVLVLVGYIIMIVIAMKGNRKTALLFLMLVIVSLFISQNYFLSFNLTVVILLGFLIYHFYKNFDETRTLNAGIVWFGFLMIMLSHIVLIFMVFSNKFYIASNLLLMGGFGLLLLNYILVLRK